MPKEGPHCICLSVMIDFVFKIDKNYYPQVFLEECIYIFKEKINRYINDDLKISFDESDEEISDTEQFGV